MVLVAALTLAPPPLSILQPAEREWWGTAGRWCPAIWSSCSEPVLGGAEQAPAKLLLGKPGPSPTFRLVVPEASRSQSHKSGFIGGAGIETQQEKGTCSAYHK